LTDDLILSLFALFLTAIIIVYALRTYVLTVASRGTHTEPEEPSYYPFITILIPSHNEGVVIRRTLARLLELDYPQSKLDILIINDASTDNTARILHRFVKEGHIRALHRHKATALNGVGQEALAYSVDGVYHRKTTPLRGAGGRGKSAALSSALKYVDPRTEVIVLFDADHYPEKPSILIDFIRHLRDPHVCIVQGDVRTINADTNILTRFVAAERDGANIDQNGRSVLGMVPQHSGTAAAIRLSFLRKIGGWDAEALCDDTDITFAAILRGYRIVYDPSIVSWEEGVDNVRAYWRQRTRWARGHMRVFFKYWRQVLTSRHLHFWQKVDGLLLLAYYFVPLCVGISFLLTLLTLALHIKPPLPDWLSLTVILYCAPALFIQLGYGLYYRRVKAFRFLALLLLPIFSVINIVICVRALYMEVFGIQRNIWVKTQRKGSVMKDLAARTAQTEFATSVVPADSRSIRRNLAQ